jgi:hypothetical protein
VSAFPSCAGAREKNRNDGFATVLPPGSVREGFTIVFAGNSAILPFGMTAKEFDDGR